MRKLLIDLLPRARKFFTSDFKQPRRLQLKNKYLCNNLFRRFDVSTFFDDSGDSSDYMKSKQVRQRR